MCGTVCEPSRTHTHTHRAPINNLLCMHRFPRTTPNVCRQSNFYFRHASSICGWLVLCSPFWVVLPVWMPSTIHRRKRKYPFNRRTDEKCFFCCRSMPRPSQKSIKLGRTVVCMHCCVLRIVYIQTRPCCCITRAWLLAYSPTREANTHNTHARARAFSHSASVSNGHIQYYTGLNGYQLHTSSVMQSLEKMRFTK